jgi:hypothetical protein
MKGVGNGAQDLLDGLAQVEDWAEDTIASLALRASYGFCCLHEALAWDRRNGVPSMWSTSE